MNNDEKILSMLEALTGKVDNIENDMKDVKSRLTNVEADIKDVKGRLTNVENKIVNIEEKVLMTNLNIENKIIPSIGFLTDGHKTLADRLWHLPEEFEDMKESVSILKFVQEQTAKSRNK